MVELSEDQLREVDARGFPERVRDRLVDDEVDRGVIILARGSSRLVKVVNEA